jgi:hypothetical protein
MKRYTVAQVRERLAEALDRADLGEPVVIERRGVRYELRSMRTRKPAGRRQVRIETVDPAVAAGTWQWAWSADGLTFVSRRKGR